MANPADPPSGSVRGSFDPVQEPYDHSRDPDAQSAESEEDQDPVFDLFVVLFVILAFQVCILAIFFIVAYFFNRGH